MSVLRDFISILEGHFDNKEQFEAMEAKGEEFPYARHVNTACNSKIDGLPGDFGGIFILEESYYTQKGSTHASPHLFLFTEEADGSVKLTSYDMPDGYDNSSFTYDKLGSLSYDKLRPSSKFTPAIYRLHDGIWEGGSESMFSPVLKFTLFERFSEKQLEVSESMEVNGRRTFGFDEPIIYKRIS